MSNHYVAGRVFIAAALVIFSVSLAAQAGSFTDRVNIQDNGIRFNSSILNDTGWAVTTAVDTGSYFALSQFDISDVASTVDSASLDLWVRDAASTGSTRNITIYVLDSADEDWVETEATGLQKSSAAGMWSGGTRPCDISGESVVHQWIPSYAGVRESVIIDVTDLVQQMADEGRLYGTFYITDPDMPSWESQTYMGQKEVQWERGGGASNYATQLLSVTSSGPVRYILTVESGTAATYVNLPGSVIDIDADAAPQYFTFDSWVGDTTGIDDVYASSTTITTQATDATITASYVPLTYNLTVTNGSGSDVYDALSVVDISADLPATGEIFYVWLGDTANVSDVHEPDTTITIYGDASVTASYRSAPVLGDLNDDGTCDVTDLNMILIDWGKCSGLTDPRSDASGDGCVTVTDLNIVLIDWGKTETFFLTVTSGSGSGEYDSGQVVPISADTAPVGMGFAAWIGDVVNVANTSLSDTTITITADAAITATYVDEYYTLTVNNGTGDGSYTNGHVVDIDAAPAIIGQQFNAWAGDIAGVADPLSASTTITMPPSDATITATYIDTGAGSYNITVIGGSGSGSYDVGETVYITAFDGAPDANELFTWSGSIGALAAEDMINWDTSFVIPPEWPIGYYDPWTITANYVAIGTPSIRTDYELYPKPPLPTQPAAGGKYIDPVFGTEIMRVTDEFDGSDCHSVEFSTWQAFNADTTMFHVVCDGVPKLYDLDKSAFTISNKRNLLQSHSPDGALRVWDLCWDTVDPDIVYGHVGVKIYSYNVTTNTYTLIVDLAGRLPTMPTAASLHYFTMDDYNDRFSFIVQKSDWTKLGSAVYDRSLDQVIFEHVSNPHGTNLDKSGKWWSITEENEPGGIAMSIVEMANTSNWMDLTKMAPDYGPGHCDWGWETVYGAGANAILKRNLATPHTWSSIFSWNGDWSSGFHVSNRDSTDDWIVVSSYTNTIPFKYKDFRKFHDEIFQVKTDDSQQVRRLAHHRALNPEGNVGHHYYDYPLATISPNGQFIIYNSNWENSKGHGERDAYMVKIPIAP